MVSWEFFIDIILPMSLRS